MQHLNLFGRVKALLPTRVETNAIPSEQLLSKALPLGLHPSFPSWANQSIYPFSKYDKGCPNARQPLFVFSGTEAEGINDAQPWP